MYQLASAYQDITAHLSLDVDMNVTVMQNAGHSMLVLNLNVKIPAHNVVLMLNVI